MSKRRVAPQQRQIRPLSGTPTNANGQAAGMMPDAERGIFSRLRRMVSKLLERLSAAGQADSGAASVPAKPAVNRVSPYRAAVRETAAKPVQAVTACELCGRGELSSAQPNLCAICAEAMTRLFLIAPNLAIGQAEHESDQPRAGDSSRADLAWTRQMW